MANVILKRKLFLNLSNALQRASLLLGLVSLVFATSMGMHLQHLLNNGGGRHVGEVAVFVILALLAFIGSRRGASQTTNS